MIDLMQRGETEELVIELLEDSKGFVKLDTIMKHVVDAAASRTHDALDKLVFAGIIEKDRTGMRWKLKTRPIVVMEIPGDPNFRRGSE
jgi:DNA-binding IclR family transcriptional regulator